MQPEHCLCHCPGVLHFHHDLHCHHFDFHFPDSMHYCSDGYGCCWHRLCLSACSNPHLDVNFHSLSHDHAHCLRGLFLAVASPYLRHVIRSLRGPLSNQQSGRWRFIFEWVVLGYRCHCHHAGSGRFVKTVNHPHDDFYRYQHSYDNHLSASRGIHFNEFHQP